MLDKTSQTSTLSILLLSLLCAAAAHAQSTTVLSLTSTTTVHATASDSDLGAACNNFRGSCVVYGDSNGDAEGAAYTTTLNPEISPEPTSLVTSTTVVAATTTVSDADYCSGFEGSCVVYGGFGNGGEAAYTTTAGGYAQGEAGGQRALGDSEGYIAMHKGHSPGVIGAGMRLEGWSYGAAMLCVGAAMLLVWA